MKSVHLSVLNDFLSHTILAQGYFCGKRYVCTTEHNLLAYSAAERAVYELRQPLWEMFNGYYWSAGEKSLIRESV